MPDRPDGAQDLGGGRVLRAGRADDTEALLALSEAAHGPSELGAVRHLLDDPGRWTVVTARGRVVSCSVLLDHAGRYGHVPVRFGQVEYVATDADHRRQGLVRAQFEWHHRVAAHLGHHFTLITGIPYFYKRLGYSYGLQWPPRLRPAERWGEPVDPWVVAPATAADVDALSRLHHEAHAAADLVTFRPRADWEWLVTGAAGHGEELLVARRDGVAEGYARLQRHPGARVGRCEVFDAATSSVGAARALLAHARAGDLGADLAVLDRPGTPWSAALRGRASPARDYHPLYVRLPDPVGFLRHVRPVLSERLARSPFAGERGSLLVSCYMSAVRIDFADGEVTAVDAAPGIEDPFEEGLPGVAPDAMPALLLGRFGATGLEDRVDDVLLGPAGPLLDVLFPPMRADLPTTV
ncbi:MAG: GNAT family N-acetyltransferase [Acidimicrobiales bacterium]|nr:GNAT family N-acetyltransferase [Acidimicrobiales bacterium]